MLTCRISAWILQMVQYSLVWYMLDQVLTTLILVTPPWRTDTDLLNIFLPIFCFAIYFINIGSYKVTVGCNHLWIQFTFHLIQLLACMAMLTAGISNSLDPVGLMSGMGLVHRLDQALSLALHVRLSVRGNAKCCVQISLMHCSTQGWDWYVLHETCRLVWGTLHASSTMVWLTGLQGPHLVHGLYLWYPWLRVFWSLIRVLQPWVLG